MVYVIIILILLAYILNEISKKYAFNNFKYSRDISKTKAEIGEHFDVTTIIENNKPLPVTFLQVIEKFPLALNYVSSSNIAKEKDYIYHTAAMSIMPYQRIKRTYKVFFNKRGRYTLYESTLKVGDVLGFNLFSKEFPMNQDMVVFPQILDLNRTLIPYGDYNGSISVKRWIIDDPILTIGIREYTGFEPQKNIHWPSSLKSSRLMVKQFDYTSESKVIVILNVECHKPFWVNIESEKIETCISLSRSIVEEFDNQGIPYGLVTNGQVRGADINDINLQTGWGTAHLSGILENLGSINYAISITFEEILTRIPNRYSTNTTFVIVTPRVLDPYIEYINNLERKCEKVILIAADNDNLDKINTNILSFVERRDKN